MCLSFLQEVVLSETGIKTRLHYRPRYRRCDTDTPLSILLWSYRLVFPSSTDPCLP